MFKRVIVVLLLAVTVLYAGDKKQEQEVEYMPTELQAARLELAQMKAFRAKDKMDLAQAEFNTALAALASEGERTKKENHWPKELNFSFEKLTFAMPPAPAAPPSVKK